MITSRSPSAAGTCSILAVVPDAMEILRHAVEDHVYRVSVEAPEDLPAARAAARTALMLPTELALGPFIGPVILDSKPRLLLRFGGGPTRRWIEEDVVLKIYGDTPRGEGPLQSRWHDRGVRTVPVVHGRNGVCSWLLMPHLHLQTPQPARPSDWLALTDAVATQARVMHEPASDLTDVLRPLDAVMLPRLRRSVERLLHAGHSLPFAWEQMAAEALRVRTTPLHGDLALTNLGLDQNGGLVVYDASALLGPTGFDAVRWAARATSSTVSPAAVLARWAQHEHLPDTDNIKQLMAPECLLEAGSRYAIARRDNAVRPAVNELLQAATQLLG